MRTIVVGLLAETFLHVGAVSSLGVVDLPVAREAATDYPFVPGSGMKGALRAWLKGGPRSEAAERLFGKQSAAGALSVSDARLALLPVRSLDGPSAWVTCPYVLERLGRDLQRAGLARRAAEVDVPTGWVLVHRERCRAEPRVLEERSFARAELAGTHVLELLEPLVAEPARDRLATQLAVLLEEDLAWFARFGLAVHARNVLNNETKMSENLWYEETLPPDAVLYTLLSAHDPSDLDLLREFLSAHPYLQLGANETVGQGWVHTKVLESLAGPR